MNDELVIIGAGPAGLSAAVEASNRGVKVLVIDENDRPGGQLFLQTHKFFGSRHHMAGVRGFQIAIDLLDKVRQYDVEVLLNTVVWGVFPGRRVAFSISEGPSDIVEARHVLIATGAVEKAVFFKGWTKPGVMGAGAAQHMMHVHRVLPGKKVLILGSGNVGLIVAYQLIQAGAEVVGVIEALGEVSGYQVHAGKIRRAGIPILTSMTIVEARGNPEVQSAVIAVTDSHGKAITGTELEVSCDLICLAVGLQPFNELCWSAGLRMKYLSSMGGFISVHNGNMETSMSGIYIAGDVSGIEEANTAMEEGRLVGIDVSRRLKLISESESDTLKTDIKRRLDSLRLGTYGKERASAKQEIEKIFNSS